jgi:hypothetical protein
VCCHVVHLACGIRAVKYLLVHLPRALHTVACVNARVLVLNLIAGAMTWVVLCERCQHCRQMKYCTSLVVDTQPPVQLPHPSY